MKKSKKDILAEDALIREVTDDVKNDQLRQLWNQYGLFVIIFVALALTAAVSFESFRSWINKKNQEVSNAYAVALSLQNQGRFDESLKLFQTLANKSGIYGDIAKLQIANIYMEQNKRNEAIEQLEALAFGKGVNEQMHEIASLKLAAIKLDDNAPFAEVKEILDPLLDEDGESYGVAHELLAMLYIRDGNLVEAKKEYEAIIASIKSSDAIKSRAQDMITIIEDQSK